MAGSFSFHLLTEDKCHYLGQSFLENMGDMSEAVEEMAFMLLHIQHAVQGGADLIAKAREDYYQCRRRERPWPDFMQPGISNG